MGGLYYCTMLLQSRTVRPLATISKQHYRTGLAKTGAGSEIDYLLARHNIQLQ